jgi:hypothetical protein
MSNANISQNIIDVYIKECKIVSSVGVLEMMPVLVELNYFEDIFSNSISGNLLINDSSSLHNKYSWSGNEYLILSFGKTDDDTIIKKVCKIYSMSNRTTTSETNENYILNFCSEELLLAQKIRISKTYKNSRIDEIVKDIAFQYLKIDPKEFLDENIEMTYGTHNITIPNLRPYEAINWLCNYAISNNLPNSRESGATYLFWQNRYGYFFKSLLEIFKNKDDYFYKGWENTGNGYWYGVKNVDVNRMIGSKDSNSSKIRDSEQIITYNILKSYNSIENIKKGVFANKLITIDPLTRTYRSTDFNYENYEKYTKSNIDLYKKENKYSIMSNAQDRFGKKYNEYSEGVIKVITTNTGQIDNKFIKTNQNEIKDINIEYTFPYRAAQFGLLDTNVLKIVIPGDHNIGVGMIVKVNIPQTTIDTTNSTKPENKFLSGFYLVSAIRHVINNTGNFKTVLELRKDSYYDTLDETPGLTDFDNNNTQLNSLKSKNSIY